MRRSFLGRLVPAVFTLVGAAIPAVTAAGILQHAMNGGTTPSSVSSASSSSATSVAAVVTPTPRPVSTATSQPTASTTRTITGLVEQDQFGEVQATITVTGNKITSVSITAPEDNPRSAAINQGAVPLLQSETLQAQSANINLVSGATITSNAYIQSLQGALQSAGL